MSSIDEILGDKALKAKQKVALIGQLLLDNEIIVQHLVEAAGKYNESNKASIIESMEYASKIKAEMWCDGARLAP